MEWATKMKVMRAARGLSQLDLVAITEIPNTYLSSFETGKSLPPPEWERAIKLGLGWPEDGLAEIAFGILDGTLTSAEAVMLFLPLTKEEQEGETPRRVRLGVTEQ